jgi:hypothetical protein
MSQSWIMVTVEYTRIPKSTEYKGHLKVVRAEELGETLKETPLESLEFLGMPMEDLVRLMHERLNKWPTAKLTMIRPPAEKFLAETERDNPRAFEIDEVTTKIIREDLDKALEMFAPIEQTVQVKPTTPRLEKENEDATGEK